MKHISEEVSKMKDGDKIEATMKAFYVLNGLPKSQGDDIVRGILSAANLYDLDIAKTFSKKVNLPDVQLGRAKSIWG